VLSIRMGSGSNYYSKNIIGCLKEVNVLFVVTPSQMRQIDQRAIHEFKIPGIVLMENAALQVVNVIKERYPLPHFRQVLILAGSGNNGGDGLAVARHLCLLGYQVSVLIVCSKGRMPKGDAGINLEMLQALRDGINSEDNRIDPQIDPQKNFDSRSFNTGASLEIYWLNAGQTEEQGIGNDAAQAFRPQQGLSNQTALNGLGNGRENDSYCGFNQAIRTVRNASLIVDGLFGTGLDRPVAGVYAAIVDEVNRCSRPVVAIDIPSGINGETGHVLGTAIQADDTVTFGYLKLGHLLFPGREYAGQVHVKPIGLPLDSAQNVGAQTFTLDDYDVAQQLKPRPRDGHKGTFGKVAVIAGSTGLTGAASMTSISALRSGAGLVTLGIPASLNPIMEEKLTEVMTVPLRDEGQGHLLPESFEDVAELLKDKDVLAIGPGCGKNLGVFEILRNIFGKIHISIVIDADGLNHISKDMNLLKAHSSPVILTPHPGEMSRLTGISLQDILKKPVEIAVETARTYNVIVLLKGATSVVADPRGKVYINPTGNSGMGKGGSGDILTGMIASLVAQGYSPFDAAVLGCYIHGKAGDEAAAHLGEVGMIAGDIIDAIPETFKKLYELKDTRR
jgi:hydroxyethylthiazole kinase-like uncharacterized protein yjeF